MRPAVRADPHCGPRHAANTRPRLIRAYPSKGGDAKPPVLGRDAPRIAGLPVPRRSLRRRCVLPQPPAIPPVLPYRRPCTREEAHGTHIRWSPQVLPPRSVDRGRCDRWPGPGRHVLHRHLERRAEDLGHPADDGDCRRQLQFPADRQRPERRPADVRHQQEARLGALRYGDWPPVWGADGRRCRAHARHRDLGQRRQECLSPAEVHAPCDNGQRTHDLRNSADDRDRGLGLRLQARSRRPGRPGAHVRRDQQADLGQLRLSDGPVVRYAGCRERRHLFERRDLGHRRRHDGEPVAVHDHGHHAGEHASDDFGDARDLGAGGQCLRLPPDRGGCRRQRAALLGRQPAVLGVVRRRDGPPDRHAAVFERRDVFPDRDLGVGRQGRGVPADVLDHGHLAAAPGADQQPPDDLRVAVHHGQGRPALRVRADGFGPGRAGADLLDHGQALVGDVRHEDRNAVGYAGRHERRDLRPDHDQRVGRYGQHDAALVLDRRGRRHHRLGDAQLGCADPERGWHAAHGPRGLPRAVRAVGDDAGQQPAGCRRSDHHCDGPGAQGGHLVLRGEGVHGGRLRERSLDACVQGHPVSSGRPGLGPGRHPGVSRDDDRRMHRPRHEVRLRLAV